MTIMCKNFDDPDYPGDCLGIADDRYTMDFSDVEPGAKIYWCSRCGPGAQAIETAITEACEDDPSFAKRFEAAIEKAKRGDA